MNTTSDKHRLVARFFVLKPQRKQTKLHIIYIK